jgi:hypothetical protein
MNKNKKEYEPIIKINTGLFVLNLIFLGLLIWITYWTRCFSPCFCLYTSVYIIFLCLSAINLGYLLKNKDNYNQFSLILFSNVTNIICLITIPFNMLEESSSRFFILKTNFAYLILNLIIFMELINCIFWISQMNKKKL